MRRSSLVLLIASAVLLTACGGDSNTQKAPGTPENPLRALPNPAPTRVPPTDETGRAAKSKSSSKADAEAKPKSVAAAQQATQSRNEAARAKRAKAKDAARVASRKQKGSAASAKRPCSLVTKAQAQSIIGVPILEPLEAPQGPTCIYQSKTRKQYVTLTVQNTDFARLKAQVRKRREVAVSTRTAVCGTYGRPMLYLPLNGGRVLSVAGRCGIASRFAATAVPHL
jgi:hypothetical protein